MMASHWNRNLSHSLCGYHHQSRPRFLLLLKPSKESTSLLWFEDLIDIREPNLRCNTDRRLTVGFGESKVSEKMNDKLGVFYRFGMRRAIRD